MLNDLGGQGAISRAADFIVIGAGTVGLPISVLLARKTGATVICLETGGLRQEEDTHPLNEVVQQGMFYKGASHGRFRCLGGTSMRWGGALIPFQNSDLCNAHWPISLDELTPFIGDVERLFSLEPGPYSDVSFPFELGGTHVNRLAKWPEFRKRNVAALLDADVAAAANLQVWLNAHVVKIKTQTEGVRLEAVSPNGDRLAISGRKLIVAAGAIETTRLALLIDRQNNGAVSALTPALGHNFTDHISAEVAEIVASESALLNKIVGFRFGAAGSMRNIRFELAPQAEARRHLPPGFCHIGFEVEKPGGFDVLREIFRSVQRRKSPPPRVMFDLIANTPWLARAMWWRLVNKRLLFPAHSRLIVHAVVEQLPSPNNRITLSDTCCDRFGLPLAEINWRLSTEDKENVIETSELFKRTWRTSKFASLGVWKSIEPQQIWANIDNAEGIFHPTGSTRMGACPADGVVDKNLNLFGVANVQLLATSVLPTGGGANPTMMLLLLGMRCVNQHAAGSTPPKA
ncbi:choline dehydrogenase-like flavoprotein [Paraburkholderia sp. RAU6.4a]|uniref:GMC oxidoreductase n=1 Tax=Paraburkholderia sp. RAU6.4a TaxID=2991067 RepID=UPI003D1B409F